MGSDGDATSADGKSLGGSDASALPAWLQEEMYDSKLKSKKIQIIQTVKKILIIQRIHIHIMVGKN